MKKILLLLLFPIILFSQTQQQREVISAKSNVAVLKELSKKYKLFFEQNRLQAEVFAQAKNWPLEMSTSGNYSQLVGITENGKPIYYTTYNRGAGITSRANKLYDGGGLGLNVQGENMISGIWDAAAVLTTHELFEGRVQVMDNTVSTNFHSTHVAGTIIGSDQFQGGSARGMAFKARLQSYNWTNDMSEMAAASADGLLLSNHSYGYNPGYLQLFQWGKYDNRSQVADEIMYNAPYYQVVCAAGNARNSTFNIGKNGYDLLSGYGVSKNGITVAAVQEVLDYTGPESVIMSYFSNWGPTDDGRIKPDISAKGVGTFSAIDSNNSSYNTLSGTSMASPSVDGTLLLLQQYYNQLNGSFMKASTLRGLMIHSADEAGPTVGPDYQFGWGLINAEKAANIITKKDVQSYILENTLVQGGTYTIAVASVGSEPLLATLAWTDPRGGILLNTVDLNTPSLVNDLDIRITKTNQIFYPWKLNPANPSAAAVQSDNIVDNVEKVAIDNPSGSYTITVSHKGNLYDNTQNYSLIVSGITVKDFWLAADENSKSICSGNNSIIFPFQLTVKTNFNETISLTALNLPAGIAATFSPGTMTASGTFGVTFSNLSALPIGNYTFIVRGESASESFEMPVTLAILSPVFAVNTLQLPLNNSANVSNPAAFSWSVDSYAQQYDIQIATDANFNNIVESATVASNNFTSTILRSNKVYYWRVRSINTCASGNYSAVSTFTTACVPPSDFQVLNAASGNATIGWTDYSDSTSWQLEIVPHGNAPTGTGIAANSNPYLFTGLTQSSCYDVYIYVNCLNSNSQWVGPYTFCMPLDYCGGAHFYDSGGADGNYQNSEFFLKTIFPSSQGLQVHTIFNSFNAGAGDYMEILNGPNVNSPTMYNSNWGSLTSGAFIASNYSGALTFIFHSDSGETASGWDATISCEPLPACPSAPYAPYVSNLAATSATIGWFDNTDSAAWETRFVLHGETPPELGTITTSNSVTLSGLVKNTCYDFYVRSLCDAGTSNWIGPLPFCTTPDYCGGDHFYDTGGPDNNYPAYEYKITTIYPETAGDRIRAEFNNWDLDLDSPDQLEIYNGPDTGSPLLFAGDFNHIPTSFAATNASGALTFLFTSNANDSGADGWDATIICEPMPPCAIPPSDLYVSGIRVTTAVLNWNENGTASSWEVDIVPQGNSPSGTAIATNDNVDFPLTGLIKNTCYDAYVRSICSDGSSEWIGPYPFCTTPDYCAGDHFYDSGGPTGNYQNYEYTNTTIYPDVSTDRVRAVFSSLALQGPGDYLRIFNGPSNYYPMLYDSRYATVPLGTIAATGETGALTFFFRSNSTTTSSGWDATIICEPMPPCANPPANIMASGITKNSAMLAWTENSDATSWFVEAVLQGQTPTGIGVPVSNNPYLIIGLIKNTCYDVYIKSACPDGLSDWSTPYTFCTTPDYCGGDHFYDSGGATGNYQNNEYKTTVIHPDNAGDRIRAAFNSLQLESCCDYFRVYNGPDTNSPLLFGSNSTNTNPGTLYSTDPSGALTFVFYSNYSTVSSGWDATISCEPMPPCANPPSAIQILGLNTDTATIAWTENSNATTWELELVLHGDTPTGNGLLSTASTYTFNGLALLSCYSVYVRAICSDGPSDWTGPFDFCTQPDYCGGMHFYDTGGAAGNYQDNEDYTTTIFPGIAGERVRAFFNSYELASSYDYFTVYNGTSISDPILFSGNGIYSPLSVAATGASGALTFRFTSNASTTSGGWDARIICEPRPACAVRPWNLHVSGISATAATVSWLQESEETTSWDIAVVPQGTYPDAPSVTVNSFPYLFSGLLANSCYNAYVRALCPEGTSDWAGPYQFCTTPDYCSGDHFYDSGGATGNYGNHESRTTTISPVNPTDKVNAVFNSFQLENCCDYLSIYDGPDNSYPLLMVRNGINSPGSVTATNLSGALTFAFTSNGLGNYSGWDATINCVALGVSNPGSVFGDLEYYPNPVENTINFSSREIIADYVVYDARGKRILEASANTRKFEINLSGFSTGMYLIRLVDAEGKTKTIKVLKK